MMPILVKSDEVRSGRKAKVHHGWLLVAQESMGQKDKNLNSFEDSMATNLMLLHVEIFVFYSIFHKTQSIYIIIILYQGSCKRYLSNNLLLTAFSDRI